MSQFLQAPKSLFLVTSIIYFSMCVSVGLSTDPQINDIFIHGILLYFAFTIIRHLVLLICAVSETSNISGSSTNSSPFVSIIVPAFNEADVIAGALNSLLNLNYSNYEIIVIDDGSTDDTALLAIKVSEQQSKIKIRVISQTNSGKSSALNTGIVHARGDYFLCVDADSRLNNNIFENVFHYFEDPEVGAVGGFIAVRNPPGLLIEFQQLEYLIGQNFTRKALSYFGAVTVIPGPVGLFRREAMHDVSGYREQRDVFAEDADLTVRLLSSGWKVKGDSTMISCTEAPQDIFSLLRQRYRWKRGVFQAFYDNFYPLISTNNVRGVFIGIFLALESFLLPVVNFGLMLFFISHFLYFGDLKLMLSWYLILVSLDLITLIYVYSWDKLRIKKIGILLLDRFTYSYLLLAWGIFALFDEWVSTKMTWDKLDRAGEAS